MRRILFALVALLAVVLVVLLAKKRNTPPEVPFAKAVRQEIVSSLSTNGKVQPIDWSEAHAEVGGAVMKVFVQKGQQVAKGAPLVELDSRGAQADLESAIARAASAQAELQTFQQGGRSSDLTTITNSLATARQDLAVAQREYEAELRLQAKNAATAQDVRASKDRVDKINLEMQALESRRASLVNRPDVSAAEAKLRETQAAVDAARIRIGMATVHAPTAGIVYQFDLRQGAYLNAGDLVAAIGRLDRVRVIVYVDEPDLGRVAIGMPVTITWDAMPNRQWKGSVERAATQIVSLGTRQVGEVTANIENPDHDLLPGTNVTAEIRSQVISNTLAIPTAAIRREVNRNGVYLLDGDHVRWRTIKLGVSGATHTQIVEGLNEGESVALPTERALKDGMAITAVYP